MKKLMLMTALILLSTTQMAGAASFQIVGAGGAIIAQGQKSISGAESVGQFTVEVLNGLKLTQNLSYLGNADALVSINGVGGEVATTRAGEKAYGWCFKTNGVLAQSAASVVSLKDQDSLTWYYGYVEEVSGQWQAECQPAK